MSRAYPLFLLSAFACQPDYAPPHLEAHRGGAGLAPQNSQIALLGSLEAGVDTIEFDIVLTADRVPVIAHDPWLDGEHCTDAEGVHLSQRVYLKDLSFQEVTRDYRCGGLEDPEFPDAVVVSEPLLSLEALLVAASFYPETELHLDVKVEPEMTESAEVFSEAILGTWEAAAPENPWYVSANLSEVIQAFEGRARAEGYELRSSLIWPRFPPDSNSTSIALGTELGVNLGVLDMIGHAERAGADGVALPWQLADRRRIHDARNAGLDVQLWTLNSAELLEQYGEWPVNALITDYPLGAP